MTTTHDKPTTENPDDLERRVRECALKGEQDCMVVTVAAMRKVFAHLRSLEKDRERLLKACQSVVREKELHGHVVDASMECRQAIDEAMSESPK